MTAGPGAGPVAPTAGASGRLRPLPFEAVRITGGLWAARQRVNREVAIPAGGKHLESAGNLDNLRIVAGSATGTARGPLFMDSDVYKWLEAVAWEHGCDPSVELLAAQREVTTLVAAAQQADGYLDSVVQLRDGGKRYRNLPWSHEHYCAGHLFQAAVAQARATGDRALLGVAIRLADHLVATFGPGRRRDVDGHPVVEMALVELYRETGTPAYLELARFFVEARGHGLMAGYGEEPTYFSDRLPVREQSTVEGHAVRAVYLAAGAADVAAETGDAELLAALETQFAHMLATKTYLTGGLGARWDREAFGDSYELPPDRAYAESCAAVGGLQWAWRMLLGTGDPLYADTAERMLLNGLLPGVSLGGSEYFYVNPLQLRADAHADDGRSPAHGRRGWFECACCPANIMRTLASLSGYLATTDGEGIQLHLYAPATVEVDDMRLTVETDYPWDGQVRVRVEQAPAWDRTLSLRVPGWASGATLTADGEPHDAAAGTYASVRRQWRVGDVVELALPMPVRFTAADERVDAVRGCVAIERGPLVYAVEAVDQTPDVRVDDLRLDRTGRTRVEHRPDLLGGVTVVHAVGGRGGSPDSGGPYRDAAMTGPAATGPEVPIVAVPYFAWANRGVGAMRVWLPEASPASLPTA